MGKESHYSSKKDRVFVRGIQGQYSLKDELKRLRSMPRVIKGKDLTFNDGPQSFSKHFVEPRSGLRPRHPGAVQPEGRAEAPTLDAARHQGQGPHVQRRPAIVQQALRRAEIGSASAASRGSTA